MASQQSDAEHRPGERVGRAGPCGCSRSSSSSARSPASLKRPLATAGCRKTRSSA